MDYKEIASICEQYHIQNWSIDNNGLVDVDGSAYLMNDKLLEIPIKFGKVNGNFSCERNMLTTLRGCPYFVNGTFNCSGNSLELLDNYPQYVRDTSYIQRNNIFKVIDIPGRFIIRNNPVYYIYQYLVNNCVILQHYFFIKYFNDCNILVGKDIYIERFKAFLDIYELDNNIDVDELIQAGYTIK